MASSKTREITITDSSGAFSILKKGLFLKQDFDFEGLATLRHLLSNERARLLHVLKTEKPGSIYALAKKLGRDFKTVNEDLKLLERFGFIELTEEKTKNRIRHKPELLIDTLTINLKI